MTNHYFAEDGNYGDAEGIAIVPTDSWTEEDWDEIEMAHDWDRPRIAKIIAWNKENA